MAEYQCIRRSDAGDGYMQPDHAIVWIWKCRAVAGTRTDQFRSGFDPAVPSPRSAVAGVPRRGVQRSEPRESDEPKCEPEQPDLRQIHGSRGSAHHAARIKVLVLAL